MSSGLSFYFIYDFCLYHGMSAPVSYLLRYLPLSVALVTCSTVLVIRYIVNLVHIIPLLAAQAICYNCRSCFLRTDLFKMTDT